jgi:hypothetical protein
VRRGGGGRTAPRAAGQVAGLERERVRVESRRGGGQLLLPGGGRAGRRGRAVAHRVRTVRIDGTGGLRARCAAIWGVRRRSESWRADAAFSDSTVVWRISDPRRWVCGQLVRNNVHISTRACKQSPFPEKSSAAENERCVEPLLTMASWPLALLRAARQRRSLRGTSRPAKRRVRPRTRPRRPRPAPSRVVACPRPLAPARRAARIGRRSESSPRARDGTEGLRRSPCPRTSTSSSSRNGACYS